LRPQHAYGHTVSSELGDPSTVRFRRKITFSDAKNAQGKLLPVVGRHFLIRPELGKLTYEKSDKEKTASQGLIGRAYTGAPSNEDGIRRETPE
jgi:hypothetical protein